MRTLLLIAIAFPILLMLYSFGRSTEQGIKVVIINARNDKGNMLISLYKDGVGFPDDPKKAVKRIKLNITNKKAEVLFTNLPAGTYAVAILHDENNDQKINKTLFGIPKEGFGFSNNVIGTFGPPSFSRASFIYTPGKLTPVTIKTKYF